MDITIQQNFTIYAKCDDEQLMKAVIRIENQRWEQD
jgi:hypothetical protein